MLTRLRKAVQRTCEFILEGQLDVACIQSRGLNEAEAILAREGLGLWEKFSQYSVSDIMYCTLMPHTSSVGTARRCLKSLLFPTSMMTMFVSA